MIKCPHCGASNKDRSKFCGDCGQPLGSAAEGTCAMCGAPNPPGSTVCSACGARLIPLSEPPSEEPGEAVEEEGEGEEVVHEEETEEAPTPPEAEVEEPLPPWVEKLQELPSEEAPEEPEAEKRLAAAEIPDWLEIPPEFEDMLSEAVPPEGEEGIARAEIPPWLEELRPGEEGVAEPREPTGPAEATGLLKGVKGILGIEPVLAIPRRAKSLPPLSFSSAAIEGAEAFDSLAREPARAKAEVVRPRRVESLLGIGLRWMIYLIVATGVVAPIFLGTNWAAANMPVTAPTIAMYEAIEELPPGSVVLVSHDYDPAVAAEMIPQAKAVLHHLMKREVRLINVSLTPEGSRFSKEVVEEVGEAHGYTNGEDYVDLGYVVGAEVGPRSIAEDLLGLGGIDFAEKIEDLALIVELAGGADYLRLWLEQVQAPYQVPMVAGVSATVDPFARPYYHNEARRQLLGLISGLVGAAEYERYSGQSGVALPSMDSQSLVHVSIVLLVLVGNVAHFGGKLRKR